MGTCRYREHIKQLNQCMEENEHNGYIYSEEVQLEAPLYSSSSAYSDGSSSPFIENSPNDSPPSGFLAFLVGNLFSYSVFSAYDPFEGSKLHIYSAGNYLKQ